MLATMLLCNRWCKYYYVDLYFVKLRNLRSSKQSVTHHETIALS